MLIGRQSVLKKNASSGLIAGIQRIEDRADDCFRNLPLLKYPSNTAIRCLLVGGIRLVEKNISEFGDNSLLLQNALINLSRMLPVAMKWVVGHGREISDSAKGRWTLSLEAAVEQAICLAHEYSRFLNCFPLWHKNAYGAELISASVVRFTAAEGNRSRQVSAYQKGIRSSDGYFKGVRAEKLEPGPGVKALFYEVLESCQEKGSLRLEYSDPWDLWFALLPEYRERVSGIVRRADALSLGSFTLGEFKQFYSALLSVCAAHEFLCFLRHNRGGRYPLDSCLLVRSSDSWTSTLARLSGVTLDKCATMVRDLTFDFSSSMDLHVQPIVPLDASGMNLAVAPQFPLHSRPDENILRVCSLLRPADFDLTSVEKEREMREDLFKVVCSYHLQGPVTLPQPLPDIDLVAIDEESSTVIICELKWIRKIMRSVERVSRDAEVSKGIRQLQRIRGFLSLNPNYLCSLNRLPKRLTEYANVYYLLVARDHWLWVEPTEEFAIVEFDAFRKTLQRNEGLHNAMTDLLGYD